MLRYRHILLIINLLCALGAALFLVIGLRSQQFVTAATLIGRAAAMLLFAANTVYLWWVKPPPPL